jgi:flagellar hook-associated protein 2
LNLLKPTPTGAGTTPPTLSVLTDTGTIENNIKAFVTAYNTLAGTFSSLGSFDATTEKAGPMLGDALLTGMKTQVQRALYSVVPTGSSTYNTLASIGITSKSDGTLSLDMTKLGTALSTNFSSVSALFSSTNGVATSLNSLITQNLGTKGAVASRSQTLVNQENDLTKQTNELNDQMTALTASLTLQYSSLNTLLSSLQTTSAYLTQALAALPSVQSSKSG